MANPPKVGKGLAAAPDVEDARAHAPLVRALGLLENTTLVVGGIIGISIFVVPSDVARLVGAPGLVLGAYVLAGCCS